MTPPPVPREDTPIPRTDRAPLSAATAIEVAANVAPLTLEGVHGTATAAHAKAMEALRIAKAADSRTMATEAKLTALETSVNRSEGASRRAESAALDAKKSIDEMSSTFKLTMMSLGTQIAAKDAAEQVQEKTLVETTTIAKDTAAKLHALSVQLTPSQVGKAAGGTCVVALVGILAEYGPQILNAVAHAVAIANGHAPITP